MWAALRAELEYFRPWLLGGLGIAAGVAVFVSVVFHAVGDEGPPPHAAAGIRGMFLMMAPMIVAFIAQSFRIEERRNRLMMAGSLTPRQLAGVAVLLPVVFFFVGAVASAILLALEAWLTGRLELEGWQIAGYVGGLLFAMNQMGLLIQEAGMAQREGRTRASVGAWIVVGAVVLAVLALSMSALWRPSSGSATWVHLHLSNLIVAVTAAGGSVLLFRGRTDFTR